MWSVTEEQKIERWWNAVKDLSVWSGAGVGIAWAELWEEAREELRVVYRAALNGSSADAPHND